LPAIFQACDLQHDRASASGGRRPSKPRRDCRARRAKEVACLEIAGKPLHRLDTADKLDGSKKFVIDLQLPGMLNAAIKQCPVFGGKLVSFDAAAIAVGAA